MNQISVEVEEQWWSLFRSSSKYNQSDEIKKIINKKVKAESKLLKDYKCTSQGGSMLKDFSLYKIIWSTHSYFVTGTVHTWDVYIAGDVAKVKLSNSI